MASRDGPGSLPPTGAQLRRAVSFIPVSGLRLKSDHQAASPFPFRRLPPASSAAVTAATSR